MRTFLIFLGIGLFIGTAIGAAVKMVRTPGRGNWFLSAVCAIVAYWGSALLLILATPHLGIIPQEVKQYPFGLQAMAFNIWVFGVASFVAITSGVRLAPPGPRALWIYSGAVMAWGLWEFVSDSSAAGRLVSVLAPVATFIGAIGAAWFTRSFQGGGGSGIGKPEPSKSMVENYLRQNTLDVGRSSSQSGGIANTTRNKNQDKAPRDTSMWQRPATTSQPMERTQSVSGRDDNANSKHKAEPQRDTSMWQRPVNLPDNENK